MAYSDMFWNSVKILETKLQRSLNIINSYQVPTNKYNDVQKKITFVEQQVNTAVSSNVDESVILGVIENTYIPFADKLYDHLRWFMNRVA